MPDDARRPGRPADRPADTDHPDRTAPTQRTETGRPVPESPRTPVPRNDEDWRLKIKSRLTINDHIQIAHRELREDDEYLRLVDAIYDSEAIEGSLTDDDVMAALKIRKWAEEYADSSPSAKEILKANTATIRRAHLIVLNRYGMGRKQRRKMVGGQPVDGDGNGGEET